jgi:DNA-binding SARP family transcriptional activator
MVRAHVAGTLWLDTPERKAAANLRSAVWRIGRLGHRLIDATRTHLRITRGVGVDVTEATQVALHLTTADEPVVPLPPNLHKAFSLGDLLPDWYDEADWLLIERARFHQLRLHALERLSAVLVRQGRFHEAVDAALAAVAAEPLRESAHRTLISAHISEGNCIEAIRQYDTFRTLIANEMGATPTQQMEQLMARVW